MMAINGISDPYRDAVSRAGQIRPIQTGRFAVSEEEGKRVSGQTGDKVEFSSEGRQAAAEMPDFDQGLEKLDLSHMTKDEFMSKIRTQLGEQNLEVNWNATVDPDGQIWCKSYFDSYVSQVTEFRASAESAIKDYYADAYQEALDSSFGKDLSGQLNFIAAKYNCSWSEYFDASMPVGERQWAYTQVRAMLTGTGLRLNDPYALKGLHIPDNEEITKIAKQFANDTISELVRQAKEANSPHQG